jgi:DNA-binding response OmpR family regulator
MPSSGSGEIRPGVVLVADDDRLIREMVAQTLEGRTLQIVTDGDAAWAALQAPDAPRVAVLDWTMPGLTGPDVCRRVRAMPTPIAPYIILLTSHSGSDDIVAALSAGADDYVCKPFHPAELRARVHAGDRIVALQETLADRVKALETALAQVKQLRGLLPICAYCKQIRSAEDYWQQVETYIMEYSEAEFTHGISPACFERIMRDEGVR